MRTTARLKCDVVLCEDLMTLLRSTCSYMAWWYLDIHIQSWYRHMIVQVVVMETGYAILVHVCSVWLKPNYFLVAYKSHTQLEKCDAIACLDHEWSHSIERTTIYTIPQTTSQWIACALCMLSPNSVFTVLVSIFMHKIHKSVCFSAIIMLFW